MDYLTFATRKAAKAELAKFFGWSAKIVKLYLPDDPNADADGNTYVIRCGERQYVRTDGYIR